MRHTALIIPAAGRTIAPKRLAIRRAFWRLRTRRAPIRWQSRWSTLNAAGDRKLDASGNRILGDGGARLLANGTETIESPCCCEEECYYRLIHCQVPISHPWYVVACADVTDPVINIDGTCWYVDDSTELSSIPGGMSALDLTGLTTAAICDDCVEGTDIEVCTDCEKPEIPVPWMIDGVDFAFGMIELHDIDPMAAEAPYLTPNPLFFYAPWDASVAKYRTAHVGRVVGLDGDETGVTLELNYTIEKNGYCRSQSVIRFPYPPGPGGTLLFGGPGFGGNNCYMITEQFDFPNPQPNVTASITDMTGWVRFFRTKHYDPMQPDDVGEGPPDCECEELP